MTASIQLIETLERPVIRLFHTLCPLLTAGLFALFPLVKLIFRTSRGTAKRSSGNVISNRQHTGLVSCSSLVFFSFVSPNLLKQTDKQRPCDGISRPSVL
jgi:hypothetical protein